jgi:hypothetical protein
MSGGWEGQALHPLIPEKLRQNPAISSTMGPYWEQLVGLARIIPSGVVEPVLGLGGSQDGSQSRLGREQVQARDEADHVAMNVPILDQLPTTPSIPLQSASPHRRTCEKIVKVALVL